MLTDKHDETLKDSLGNALTKNLKDLFLESLDRNLVGNIKAQKTGEGAWEEKPVDILEFIDSPDYLGLRDQTYPVIKEDLHNIFSGGYTEVAIDEGIGSGKSFLSSIAIVYLVYRTECLKDPQAFYSLAPGSNIAFMNMAINASQAKKVVFKEIRNKVLGSKWFKEKCRPDSTVTSELRFPKGIVVVPGNSKETFPLGYNLLGAVLDEAAFYTETSDHDVAEEIYSALKRRISSRFFDAGMLLMISSPRYVDDFIERKIEEAKDQPKIYARRRAIWEVKPKEFYSGETFKFDVQSKKALASEDIINIEHEILDIPIEYKSDFERGPEKSLRDLAARASLTIQGALRNPMIIKLRANKDREHPMDEKMQFKPWLRGLAGNFHYVHVDLGLNNCAAGICMAHPTTKDGETEICIDFMLKIKPEEGKDIDFAFIRDIIFGLKSLGFNILLVTYDQWQSVDSLQILERAGFKTENYSVDRNPIAYDTLLEYLNTNRLDYYYSKDFEDDMQSLEQVKGKSYNHRPGGQKDLSDAVAAVCWHCVSEKGNPTMKAARLYSEIHPTIWVGK